MKVKGVAFVAKKMAVIAQHGDDRWDDFMEKLADKDPYFETSILSPTLIPLEKFLKWHDALIKEYYSEDDSVYWAIGKKSADFSFGQGVYSMYQDGNVQRFTDEKADKIWNLFFSEGKLDASFDGRDLVSIKVTGLPRTHPYLEFVIMGYIMRTYEIVSNKTGKAVKVSDSSLGPNDYFYKIKLS